MKFAEIAGHKNVIDALRKSVDEGRIPHALLLSGISGIGKMRLARALAQYIHCKNRQNGDSCGKCPSCLQHNSLNNPDLHFIFPVLKKEGLAVSNDYIDKWREFITDRSFMPPEIWNEYINAGNSQPVIYVNESESLLNKASLSAFQEDFKIFIIWLPEKMRPEAANKLLKIIEEPFEDTIFIFVSNDDSKVLPTIFSRTQRYNLHPLSETELVEHLSNKSELTPEKVREAAHIAEGSISKAEEYAYFSDELLEFHSLFMELMRSAYVLKAKKLKELSETVAAMGREKSLRFLNYCSRMVRENFIKGLKLHNLTLMTESENEFSRKFSQFIHEGNVEKLSDDISKAAAEIERNVNAKIVLFDLLLLMSQSIRMPRQERLPFL